MSHHHHSHGLASENQTLLLWWDACFLFDLPLSLSDLVEYRSYQPSSVSEGGV